MLHGAFPNHAVQADAVQQESTHIHSPVAVIGGRKPRTHVDDHLTIESRRDAEGFGQNGLDEDFGVGHQGVTGLGTVIEGHLQERG